MNALVGVLVVAGVLATVRFVASGRRASIRRRLDRHRLGAVHAAPSDRRVRPGRTSRRTSAAVERCLPALAEAIARELRSGASLTTALREAGSLAGGAIASDIGRVERLLASGTDLGPALATWATDRPTDGVRRLVAVMSIGHELGGELAPTFELTADALRDRLELLDEIGSLTSQSRASGVLLTGLPPIAALGLAILDPATGRFLLASGAGLVCICGAVALDAAGWLWMRTLVRSVR